MTHKKTVGIVRKFLKKTQAWVDKTPGVVSVSMDIGDRAVILAEKKRPKCWSRAIYNTPTPRAHGSHFKMVWKP